MGAREPKESAAPVTNWRHVVIDANGQLGTIDPQTGGGAPIGASDAALVDVVREQQETIAELRDRLAKLEALITPRRPAAR